MESTVVIKRRYFARLALVAIALGLAAAIVLRFVPGPGTPQVPEQKPGASTPRPQWAVRPSRPGSDRPPVGRSLFDVIATREQAGQPAYDIPFPFEALLQRVNERAGCAASAPCVRAVLIPLGRSLQRMAAAPDFFRHPRIVAAVDGEGDSAMALLKDRLYLGYQQQAGLIEVISYNEAAGRFEFQLVHDYRAGATPRVSYARRDVCAACHQNLSPIFSRPLWAETNANPRVAAALQTHGDTFFGVAVRRGVDIPDAIDASTDRANLFGVWQRLWHDGCGDDPVTGQRCRGAALLAALQYRLSGQRGFDEAAASWRTDFLPIFAHEWRMRWPAGLAIPNPDLPSRDPLPAPAAPLPTDASLAHIPARFEPLQPRPPLEIWTAGPPTATDGDQVTMVARRYVAGLGSLFSVQEIAALDRHLRASPAADIDQRRFTARCALDRDATTLRWRCDGTSAPPSVRFDARLELRGERIGSGVVEGLAVAGQPSLHRLMVTPGLALSADGTALRLYDRDLHARLADGTAVDSITLRWRGDAGDAIVTLVDDLAPLRGAVAAMANAPGPASTLAAQPFDRTRLTAALFSRLGISGYRLCCNEAQLPPARIEAAAPSTPERGPAQPFAAFYPMCAGCHATGERSPPNFLSGSDAQVVANLRHCAPRLYVRLAMWRHEPAQRVKTPMPPPLALPYPHAATPPAQIEALERSIADLLRAETGRTPQLDALLVNDYETLRPCLPEAG